MAQPVKAAQGSTLYSYEDRLNASDGSAVDGAASTEFNPMNSKLVWGFSILLVLVIARIFTNRSKLPAGVKRLPRLPGVPWVGRFWGIPVSGAEAAWHFGDFHKTYGPIYEWETFGVIHIWIESDKIARDLLVHRGKKYGDRHELPAAVGVRGGSEILPLMGIGENFRRHKNFIHTIMRQSSSQAFYEYPAIENKHTLRRLLESPETWSESMITHCARIAARCAWGEPKHGTKLLTVVPQLLKAVSPEGPLPNILPFLQHIPEAISPFKKQEAIRRTTMQEAFYEALEDVKDRVKAGTAEQSWARIWLEGGKGMEASKLDQHEAAHAVGTNALVAIATIGSPLHSFFTAMCHYPSWMKKVQAEIDAVCGDRLPTMADMPNLPVLRAVVKETLRWRQPTPLGVPHITTEEDIYEGYYIPKGAMVHANHYLISREPNLYPDGNEFRPERWLESSWPTFKAPLTEYPSLRGDPGFGYGNRSCPGIELVLTELHTLIGALVWAFDISRVEGRVGHDNPVPWYETNPFVITMAKPFPCNITVRSEEKRRYIEGGCAEGGLLVKETGSETNRWDVSRAVGAPFVWSGLTVPMAEGKPPRAYAAHV
ncbi:putative P450 monooxygenase [Polychaeton citri CBS 116435]|uniref:P450 monooxygenase n=1 Tax=Polychaeton citri CBS 116435 TaxID=1314669 RepID=A0A9P4Q1J5_9PEZI|nr:putative P450 monooxygenase [Polychaeton citri CBS 116435]